jgi:sugar/nucleoside kinase (ribokinase family)
LVDAFSARLIDLYVCSPQELRDYARIAAPAIPELPVERLLQECAAYKVLPLITVVRGEGAAVARAHVAIDGQVERIRLDDDVPAPGWRLGTQNAFNAALIHGLSRGPAETPVEVAVREAVREAMALWVATSHVRDPRQTLV